MASLATLPAGEMIEMGGYRLHLRRSGPERRGAELPTAIIEAGCGFHSVMYSWLHERLAREMPVVSYDRAGLGWSDDSGKPRDAGTMAEQLRMLIDRAGIAPPLLLVGHSIAALYLRVFADRFPEDVAGMVLLDASHPGQTGILGLAEQSRQFRRHQRLMAIYGKLGLSRIVPPVWELRRADCDGGRLPSNVEAELVAAFAQTRTYKATLREFDAFDLSAKQALLAGDLGDLPLLVITALAALPQSKVDGLDDRDIWLALQRDLARLSTRSQHLVFEDAGHCTLVTEERYATQVAEAIMRLVVSEMVPSGKGRR